MTVCIVGVVEEEFGVDVGVEALLIVVVLDEGDEEADFKSKCNVFLGRKKEIEFRTQPNKILFRTN